MRRRRNSSNQGQTGGQDRWLVSYADFITLMFALFVVMYGLSSVSEGKFRVLGDSLFNAFGSNVVRRLQPPDTARDARPGRTQLRQTT